MRSSRPPRPPRSTRPKRSRSNPLDWGTNYDDINSPEFRDQEPEKNYLTKYAEYMPGARYSLDRTHQSAMSQRMQPTKHNFRIVFVTHKWRPNQKAGEESRIIGTNQILRPASNAITLAIDLSGRSYGDLHAGIQRTGSFQVDEWDALHAFGERQLKLFWAFFESYGNAIETMDDFRRRERKAIAMLDNYIWNLNNIQSNGMPQASIDAIYNAYGLGTVGSQPALTGGLTQPAKEGQYRSIDLGKLGILMSQFDEVPENDHEGSAGQRATFTVECLKYIFEEMVETRYPKEQTDKTWYSGIADLFAAAELQPGQLLKPRMTVAEAETMFKKAGLPEGDIAVNAAELGGGADSIWAEVCVPAFTERFMKFYNEFIPALYGTIWAV